MGKFFLSLLLCIISSFSQADELDLITNPPQKNMDLKFELQVLDILRVNDANQTLRIDFLIAVSWHDPRLAGEEINGTVPLEKIWKPMVIIANERRFNSKLPEVALVNEKGDVRMVQRYMGRASINVDLHDFPMDSHTVGLIITLPDAANINLESDTVDLTKKFSVLNTWKVSNGVLMRKPFFAHPKGRPIPAVNFHFKAERKVGFYIWKVLFPLFIVVFMSWAPFWIDPKEIGPQLSLAATAILTLIAYRFVLINYVPQLSYLTRLDYFFSLSTLLVFGTLAEVLITSQLVRRGKVEEARNLDRKCRWVFPLVFSVLILVCFWF